MSRRRVISLNRPEGGAEHGVVIFHNHNCPPAKMYRSADAEEFEDIDFVQMPVGVFGYEMPAGVPFEVTSTNPCDACGAYIKAMYQWTTPKLFLP